MSLSANLNELAAEARRNIVVDARMVIGRHAPGVPEHAVQCGSSRYRIDGLPCEEAAVAMWLLRMLGESLTDG